MRHVFSLSSLSWLSWTIWFYVLPINAFEFLPMESLVGSNRIRSFWLCSPVVSCPSREHFIHMESRQHCCWRPQILIMFRVHCDWTVRILRHRVSIFKVIFDYFHTRFWAFCSRTVINSFDELRLTTLIQTTDFRFNKLATSAASWILCINMHFYIPNK